MNPARDVKTIRGAAGGYYTWTIADVEKYIERHPLGTKAHLALALLLFTGAREQDMVTFGKQHVRDGWLRYVPLKTSISVAQCPRSQLPILAKIIAASPCGSLTFLETEYKKPFTANGFGGWFRDRCNEAGLAPVYRPRPEEGGRYAGGGERRDNLATDGNVRLDDDLAGRSLHPRGRTKTARWRGHGQDQSGPESERLMSHLFV